MSTLGCAVGVSVGVGYQQLDDTLNADARIHIEILEDQVVISDAFTKEDTDKAVQLFYSEWLKEFEEGKPNNQIKSALEQVEIQFTEDRIHVESGFYMDGTPLPPEGADVLGVARSIKLVQVWIREGPEYRIGKTSFAHELVHVLLKHEHNTFDPDHLGDKYKAWTKKHTNFIKKVNTKLLKQKL